MIVQGDNGTRLKLYIKEKGALVDLTGASIDVAIKSGTREIMKTAQVTGTGEAEVELTSEDLMTVGLYYTQATVRFADENKFSSDIQRFMVSKKL